jgi:uncharacterized membrane protein
MILTLQPNRSANWHQTKLLIAAMAIFISIIALIWTLVGAWLILPFAGLEMSLLAFLMYRGCYATYQKQIITLDPTQITFQAGVYYAKRYCCLNRSELRVNTINPKTEFEQTQISLQDQHNRVVIGQFLNQQDREKVLSYFREARLYIHTEKWWQPP